MINKIKKFIAKFLIIALLYAIIISSIVAGPKEIKIIFSIILIIVLAIHILIIVKFFKNKKAKEDLKEFEDWELTKYGFIAESKKETNKRIEEYLEEKGKNNDK